MQALSALAPVAVESPRSPSHSKSVSVASAPFPLPGELRLGPVRVGMPAIQAALAGYGDGPFRRIARRCGAPFALAEMILDRMVVEPNRKRTRHLALVAEDHPVGGQIIGSLPETFGPATKEFVSAGFEVVDINFGCPLNKVLGRRRGGYLLGTPETALEILDRTRTAAPPHVAVTVKMRRGVDDTAESRDRFFTILEGAFARGVDAVTVHGRTVRQKYTGRADWGFLAEAKRVAGRRTLLGSGDLFTPDDVVAMLRRTGLDGVTLARGSIGNPWIFREVAAALAGLPIPAPPTVAEQRAILEEHHALMVPVYGVERAGPGMRKMGIQYARRHPDAAEVKNAMIAMRRPEDWRTVLDRWYPEGDDRPGLPTAPPDRALGEGGCSADGGEPGGASDAGADGVSCEA